MIQGIKVTKLKQIHDERGKVMTMIRRDSQIFDKGLISANEITGQIKYENVNFYYNDLTPEEYEKMLEISSQYNQSFD